MQLGTFHQLLKDTLNIGNKADPFVATATQQAILWIERNYNFRYMQSDVYLLLAPNENITPVPEPYKGFGPYYLAVAPVVVKRIISVYTTDSLTSGGKRFFMSGIKEEDIDHFDRGRPVAYFTKGERNIFFSHNPDEVYFCSVSCYLYSVWPSTDANTRYTSTATNFMLTYGSDVLLWQACLQMGLLMRDPDIVNMAKPMFADSIRTLLLTEDEYVDGNQDTIMLYHGAGGE